MGKGQDKKKTSFDPKEKAPDADASLPGQTVDPLVSKTTAEDMRRFLLLLLVFCCVFFFLKQCTIHFFIINEGIFILFSISSSCAL